MTIYRLFINNEKQRYMMRQSISIIMLGALLAAGSFSQVSAIDLPENLPFAMEKPVEPTFPHRIFDIRDFGAKDGGKVKNTKAIAEAIDACHKSGGGKVLIPEGIWLTGPIHLKSNINLHVAEGAEVCFSQDPDDYLPVVFTRWNGVECYNYSPLIYAKDCSNIAITGKGVFDGQGSAWWPWEEQPVNGKYPVWQKLLDSEYNGIAVRDRVYGTRERGLRPQMIQLINCKKVLLEDYTSQNTPFWNNHLVYCDGVVVRNIRLLNPEDAPNSDGINIDSSKNVHIQSLFADVGDDAVCIKSGINEDGWRVGRKSENIVVENCHVKKGHGGIVFGSETSGGIRNVYVRNCLYDGTDIGIRIKSRRGRGGGVENVWIENIKMKNIGWNAVILNMFYAVSASDVRSETPPTFRNIHIKDVICEGAGSAVTFRGLPERPIENITLENVTIMANSGLNCSDAENIKLINVSITPKKGPVITLKDSRSIVIKRSMSPKGVETFLHVKGPKSSDISLVEMDLSNTRKPVLKEPEVPDDAVEVIGLDVLSEEAGTIVHDYLMAQAIEQFDDRRRRTEKALISAESAVEYQKQARRKYRELIDSFGPKTPLNPVVTGAIECDGYRIEKIAYESLPHRYVTANLYIPTTGDGPWPGVLVLCGHADSAKARYQEVCILLAKNGLVALIVDPISQGEVVQLLDEKREPVMEDGVYIYSKKIFEHSIIDYGSRLVGRGTVAYELWDNTRGIDYLLSRKEVDSSKSVGCTGNSGGGTQTTFLMAFDDRIGPAAPTCYMSTLEWVFNTRDFDDGCQHIAGEGKAGLERADYMIMRAPKPTLVLAGKKDASFDIKSTRKAYADAKRFYEVLGCPERLDMFEGNHEHGFYKPLRQKAVQWMRRWLLDDGSEVVEPDLTVQTEKDLHVTGTGNVATHWKDALCVPELNLLRAEELALERERFWKENPLAECQKEIKKIIGLRDAGAKPVVEKVGIISRKGYRIEKLKITRVDELPVPALMFVPDKIEGRRPAILYVDGRGKKADAGTEGAVEDLVKKGNVVLAIDARGFGETKNTRPYHYASYMYSNDYKNLMLSMHLGRPMLGQRVEEVLASLDVLAGHNKVDTDAIEVIGIGRAGPVVLHAAVLDDRISAVTIKQSITSWIDIIREPLAKQVLTHVVPSVLTRYDLSDLVRAIAPRPVNIVDPVGAFGKPLAGP